MSDDGIQVNLTTWSTTSTTTATGKSDTEDLVNDLFTTLGNFANEMSPTFFLDSMQNLITAVNDFGLGMSAALACVSTDLQVVSSGLSSAAAAYGATDKTLAHTFAQLDTQLGYYTNTATSTTLHTPTSAQQTALNNEYQQYYSLNTNTGNGWNITPQQIGTGLVAAAAAVGAFIITYGIEFAPLALL